MKTCSVPGDPDQRRVRVREDGGHQTADAVLGRGQQVQFQPDHGANPGGQPNAGELWQRKDHPERQQLQVWEVSGTPLQGEGSTK